MLVRNYFINECKFIGSSIHEWVSMNDLLVIS